MIEKLGERVIALAVLSETITSQRDFFFPPADRMMPGSKNPYPRPRRAPRTWVRWAVAQRAITIASKEAMGEFKTALARLPLEEAENFEWLRDRVDRVVCAMELFDDSAVLYAARSQNVKWEEAKAQVGKLAATSRIHKRIREVVG